MADADVAITAGAGTKIDTRTVGAGTDEHRQVIVIGDPATAANVAEVAAKGTQGAMALAIQQLRDSGRTVWAARSQAALAGTVTETQITLTPQLGGTVGSANVSQAVTAGKILRVTGGIISVRASAAVASWARVCLRISPSAAASATDAIIAMAEVGTPTQVIGAANGAPFNFPEGIEYSGSNKLGVTQIAAATSVLIAVSFWGYEY